MVVVLFPELPAKLPLRPGAEAEIAEGRKRCVCGAGHDPDGMAASMIWESRERLEQEIEVKGSLLLVPPLEFFFHLCAVAVRKERLIFVHSGLSLLFSPLCCEGCGDCFCWR